MLTSFDLDAELAKVRATVDRYELANSTFHTYDLRWSQFLVWCGTHGLQPLPASPATVQAYLIEYTDALVGDDGIVYLARRAASLDPTVGAIRWAHRRAGLPTPTSDRSVRALQRVLRRAVQPAQRQAVALSIEDLEVIARKGRGFIRFERAWTMLLVAFFGCFRPGELLAVRIEHLVFSADGVVVFVPRSKGDPMGRGEYVAIACRDDLVVCPVRQLLRWVEGRHCDAGWVFPGRTAHGHLGWAAFANDLQVLTGLGLSKIGGYTPHSARRGFCTSAAEAGRSLLSISLKARHKNPATTLEYISTKPGEAALAVAAAL